MKIQVSVGELLDKFSILEIKKNFIQGKDLNHVLNEIACLKRPVAKYLRNSEIKLVYEELLSINMAIWNDMELISNIRQEKGSEYYLAIENTITLNAERAHLKRQINNLSNSKLSEAKSYFAKS
jgi:hypothetical protein